MKKPHLSTLATSLILFLLGIGARRVDRGGRTGQQEEIDRFLSRPIRITNLGEPSDERAPWSCKYQRNLSPFSITRHGQLSFVGKALEKQERWRIDLDDGRTILFATAEK